MATLHKIIISTTVVNVGRGDIDLYLFSKCKFKYIIGLGIWVWFRLLHNRLIFD